MGCNFLRAEKWFFDLSAQHRRLRLWQQKKVTESRLFLLAQNANNAITIRTKTAKTQPTDLNATNIVDSAKSIPLTENLSKEISHGSTTKGKETQLVQKAWFVFCKKLVRTQKGILAQFQNRVEKHRYRFACSFVLCGNHLRSRRAVYIPCFFDVLIWAKTKRSGTFCILIRATKVW